MSMNTFDDVDAGEPQDILRLSADVVASYLATNTVAAAAIPDLIRSVHESFLNLNQPPPAPVPAERPKPAVPISRSIQDDFLVCLEDGKKLKMLKRHLKTTYNLTPEQYRERWSLPADYPMVAPNYARQRSKLAKDIGLGSKTKKKIRAKTVD